MFGASTKCLDFLHAEGYPLLFIAVGQITRMPGLGKSMTNTAGWVYGHEDGKGVTFGDFSQGFTKTFREDSAKKLSNAEKLRIKRQMHEEMERSQQEKRLHQLDAALSAKKRWENAVSEIGDHEYLKRKHVLPHGIRTDGYSLLIPVYCSGHLTSLQTITPEGKKRFHPDGAIKAGYFPIGENESPRVFRRVFSLSHATMTDS